MYLLLCIYYYYYYYFALPRRLKYKVSKIVSFPGLHILPQQTLPFTMQLAEVRLCTASIQSQVDLNFPSFCSSCQLVPSCNYFVFTKKQAINSLEHLGLLASTYILNENAQLYRMKDLRNVSRRKLPVLEQFQNSFGGYEVSNISHVRDFCSVSISNMNFSL